ncbi:MAG TPA: hypothetical protein VGR84_10840 [Candidatus Acidoferrales bacterium]|nr:hypothetical protein [Candidatus Acidoferrales bacterium]
MFQSTRPRGSRQMLSSKDLDAEGFNPRARAGAWIETRSRRVNRWPRTIYFLDHVDAEQKYLVLTDAEFYENLKRNLQGRLAPGIELFYCELPENLKTEVDRIRITSRGELGR